MATATEETTVTVQVGDSPPVPLDEFERRVSAGGLFDPEPYTLPVPRVDGTPADTLELAFSGKVVLDPANEDDLALIERLRLDADVTLSVEAAVAGKAFKVKRGEEETTTTHAIALRVHTLYRDTDAES